MPPCLDADLDQDGGVNAACGALRTALDPDPRENGDPPQSQNLLLASLPPAVFERLRTQLVPVQLANRDVLFRAHDAVDVVYFPETAVVSFVSRLKSGQTLGVGLVGHDGIASTAIFPGVTTMSCDGIVLIPGCARRIRADVLRRELLADESLHSVIARFAQALIARSMQTALCNVFHSVEQRCIRWLLTVHDLIGDSGIPLTHDALATIVGIHRPTATVVIRSLHRAGIVREERGRIVIQNRDRLVAACCECYHAMRDEQRRLLGY
jgi:CRP-like cAMP-binding protein